MSHWLEEAEHSKNILETKSSEEKIRIKKESIRYNYDANKYLYDGYIGQLEDLANRVNDLPKEFREDYGKINYSFKESKLDNHLFYLSTSRRIQKCLHRGIFTYFKKYTFKHIRVGYFSVSKQMGMIDIELKENHLLRVRMKTDGDDKRRKSKRKGNDFKKDFVFRISLESINENTAIEVIDWLAFKKEMEEISFFNEKRHELS